jgi:hypothetical protein
MKACTTANDDLAIRSTQDINVVVAHGHHYIQQEQPGLIIEAIWRIVENIELNEPLNRGSKQTSKRTAVVNKGQLTRPVFTLAQIRLLSPI